jgi:uncharacterized protein YigE (DUF2233 family)
MRAVVRPRTLGGLAAAALLLLAAVSAAAPALATGASFTVVRVDTRTAHLALFPADDDGQPFHRFDRLARHLQAQGRGSSSR